MQLRYTVHSSWSPLLELYIYRIQWIRDFIVPGSHDLLPKGVLYGPHVKLYHYHTYFAQKCVGSVDRWAVCEVWADFYASEEDDLKYEDLLPYIEKPPPQHMDGPPDVPDVF